MSFDETMEHIFKWEGGYANDPDDPGKETKFGISKKAHPDVEIPSLTKEMAKEIYKKKYWDVIKGNSLPPVTAKVLMDFAVNAGIGRAVPALQQLVGAKSDGEVGPNTLKKVQNYVVFFGDDVLARNLNTYRRGYYRGLIAARPLLKKYKKGWEARVVDLGVDLGVIESG